MFNWSAQFILFDRLLKRLHSSFRGGLAARVTVHDLRTDADLMKCFSPRSVTIVTCPSAVSSLQKRRFVSIDSTQKDEKEFCHLFRRLPVNCVTSFVVFVMHA